MSAGRLRRGLVLVELAFDGELAVVEHHVARDAVVERAQPEVVIWLVGTASGGKKVRRMRRDGRASNRLLIGSAAAAAWARWAPPMTALTIAAF
jgi:hypothetical protein